MTRYDRIYQRQTTGHQQECTAAAVSGDKKWPLGHRHSGTSRINTKGIGGGSFKRSVRRSLRKVLYAGCYVDVAPSFACDDVSSGFADPSAGIYRRLPHHKRVRHRLFTGVDPSGFCASIVAHRVDARLAPIARMIIPAKRRDRRNCAIGIDPTNTRLDPR